MLENTEPRTAAALQERRAESGAPHSSLQEANMQLESIQRLFRKIILGRFWKPAGLVILSKMMLALEATNLGK